MSRLLTVVSNEEDWSPQSWRHRPAQQQPQYENHAALTQATDKLARLPPLVTSWEAQELKRALAEAQEGRRFLLHGGDCAESFVDCTSDIIVNRLKVLLQMSLVLAHGLKQPVIRVGRFAGQYAKPRSNDLEIRDGQSLPSFRGDIVNGPEFDEASRRIDPERLFDAYAHSALTLNFTRALVDSGFGDLRHPEHWKLDWIEHSPRAVEYRRVVGEIADSLRLMKTLGGQFGDGHVDAGFYTSHEALLLHYEEAFVRRVPYRRGWYNLSTHLPWIGMRTSALDGAHVEFFRGIANPIAVKVGPTTKPDDLLRLIDVLNPYEEPGRLTLITRMGKNNIADALPPLLRAVRHAGRRVLWVADPMHGNTESTGNGYKTRRFDNIRDELDLAFNIHAAEGTRLGGVHLELTGEDVTECLGGARDLAEADLARAYKTAVDPRLNYEQSMELSMLIVSAGRAAPSDIRSTVKSMHTMGGSL
ncbi:class II 3-deoxy-7-phosphoheptulonate synthase [Dyella tabacisoli]|uniref:Phospho-2-dehydro-3-deoxyheptonate aldolase n=1 Tax=Dyella tabacisoli TaxID=2282381 RepID=A0A369UGH3_9GAMM|nr:3-deoxy-7-phosphoheptulonate synthase class II [Dyella tabacisoli]RDD79832.1 3-deoxy-7-phosphoheptulonate synthase class II [Dyella tabacisoli]